MTKADTIFKENIRKIMEEGVWSEPVSYTHLWRILCGREESDTRRVLPKDGCV